MGRELGRGGVRLARMRSSSSSVTAEGREEEEEDTDVRGRRVRERERKERGLTVGRLPKKEVAVKGRGWKGKLPERVSFIFFF